MALLFALLAFLPSDDARWLWPLDGTRVERTFAPPADDWGPGHRGVDLPGTAGATVRSVAAGRVVFVGRIAGVGVVSVEHDGERSTYQPLEPIVREGDAVEAGEPLGRLVATGSHCATPCLHLGRMDAAKEYLDPADLLGGPGRFRLVTPDGPPPRPPAGFGDGSLQRPVGGPVTSAFGLRRHPITGVRKLHDGTDFGATCGTRVRAAAAGVVASVTTHRAYGRRVVLHHGAGLQTSYNHLSRVAVHVGEVVGTGDVVGRVGSTGLSTGCHLHFMVVEDGRPVNPMARL